MVFTHWLRWFAPLPFVSNSTLRAIVRRIASTRWASNTEFVYARAEALDQPEWYFSHILNIIHDQRVFMETTIQTLLGLTCYSNINAYREFTSLLFPILARKIKRSMNQLLRDPRLLAQTIYQALAFDSQLVEDGFSLTGTSTSQNSGESTNWEGISDVILGNKEWFDAWLEAERQCTCTNLPMELN